MTKIRFPYPVETDISAITAGEGSLVDYISRNSSSGVVSSNKLPVIKPEDFEGETIAQKVIAANRFIVQSGGGYELLLKDTATYLITESIVIPSNTTIRMDGCTVQMTDNTIDNIFRTANIEIDPQHPYGFAKNKTSMESVRNIRIIGESDAQIIMCNNADSSHYGVTKTGWRGHTIMMAGCSNFEITGFHIEKNIAWGICLSGCSYGTVHDIDYNTTRSNGDGMDVEFGSHDICIYNISGHTYDDTIAVSNSGPTRLDLRPFEQTLPTCPFDYGWRKFGDDTYNIHIYNVNTTVTEGHVLIFICGDYGINNVSASTLSDNDGENTGAFAVVKVYGGQFDGNYHNGMIHNCTISNIEAYDPGTAAIFLSQGIIENGTINNVKITSGETLLRDESGANWQDYNFTITNTGTIS